MATYTSTFDGSEDPLSESSAWTLALGSMLKTSGVVETDVSGLTDHAKNAGSIGSGGQYSKATLWMNGANYAGTAFGPCTCMGADAGVNFVGYFWRCSPQNCSDQAALYRIDSDGVQDQLGSTISTPGFVNNSVAELRSTAAGSHTGYKDTTLKITQSDSTYTGTGQVGFGISSSAESDCSLYGVTAWEGGDIPGDLIQEGFRFRNDDGTETSATWKAAQDANITAPAGNNVRLRFLIDSSGDADAKQFQLEFQKSGWSDWLKITT